MNINLLRRTYVREVTEYAIGSSTNKLPPDIFLEFPKTFVYNASQPTSPTISIACLHLRACSLTYIRALQDSSSCKAQKWKLSGLRGSSVSEVTLNGLQDWDSILAGDRNILRTYRYSDTPGGKSAGARN
jgi:hypothetical protein